MSINPEVVKATYNNINRATGNHLLAILLTALLLVMPALIYAGSLWVEQSIQAEVKQQMKSIQSSINQQRVDYFQDQLYIIEDKIIDGTVTSYDKKRTKFYWENGTKNAAFPWYGGTSTFMHSGCHCRQ